MVIWARRIFTSLSSRNGRSSSVPVWGQIMRISLSFYYYHVFILVTLEEEEELYSDSYRRGALSYPIREAVAALHVITSPCRSKCTTVFSRYKNEKLVIVIQRQEYTFVAGLRFLRLVYKEDNDAAEQCQLPACELLDDIRKVICSPRVREHNLHESFFPSILSGAIV